MLTVALLVLPAAQPRHGGAGDGAARISPMLASFDGGGSSAPVNAAWVSVNDVLDGSYYPGGAFEDYIEEVDFDTGQVVGNTGTIPACGQFDVDAGCIPQGVILNLTASPSGALYFFAQGEGGCFTYYAFTACPGLYEIQDTASGSRLTMVEPTTCVNTGKQLQNFVASGRPVNLVVGPNTIVSGPLEQAIDSSGGAILVREASGVFEPYYG